MMPLTNKAIVTSAAVLLDREVDGEKMRICQEKRSKNKWERVVKYWKMFKGEVLEACFYVSLIVRFICNPMVLLNR